MSKLDSFVTLLVIGMLLVGFVGFASAHEDKSVNGYELTFGGADEPVITGERMWLQVKIVDEETGDPVEGQEDLQMAVQRPFGTDTFELDVDSVHGRPGWYEGAVVFTEPGTYTVYIRGTVEGTEIDTSFKKKVHNASALEYPKPVEASGSGFGSDVATGFGLGAVVTAVAMAAAFVVGRRL